MLRESLSIARCLFTDVNQNIEFGLRNKYTCAEVFDVKVGRLPNVLFWSVLSTRCQSKPVSTVYAV